MMFHGDFAFGMESTFAMKNTIHSYCYFCVSSMDAKGFVRLNEGEQERDSFESPAAAENVLSNSYMNFSHL